MPGGPWGQGSAAGTRKGRGGKDQLSEAVEPCPGGLDTKRSWSEPGLSWMFLQVRAHRRGGTEAGSSVISTG